MWIAIANGIGTRQGVGGGVGPTPPPYTPPLDANPATAAYSVRKLSSTYSGSCIEAYRVSDGATQDIGFDADGLIDTAAIISFASGGEVRVQTWYDQSGNSNDATQSTPSLQPQIYNGTAVIIGNAKPAVKPLDLLGALDFTMDRSSGEYSMFFVGNVFQRSTIFAGGGTSANFAMAAVPSASSNIVGNMQNTSLFVGGSASSISTAGAAYTAFLNNQSLITLFGDHTWTTDDLVIGYVNEFSGGYQNQELIIYTDDQSDNRTVIESNINNFYQITNLPDYTSGFLADYPDAAAAYSVRKLSNTAIKSMRVRRNVPPYDEQDIGFTAAGDLDEAAIVAFGGSDVLVVSRWYDQSGFSRHLSMGTVSAQPHIYDGASVYTVDGKPSVQFAGSDFLTLDGKISSFTNWLESADGFSHYVVAEKQNNTTQFISGTPSAGSQTWNYSTSPTSSFIRFGGNTGLAFNYTNSSSGNTIFTTDYNDTTGLVTALKDGELSSNSFTSSASDTYIFNGISRFSSAYSGGVSEAIIYLSTRDSVSANIQSDINGYYEAFPTSGFLVDYPGAKAAYSLRKLQNVQQYAIQVQRTTGANDTLDIGFDSNGDLDTQAIIDFGGSDTLGVSIWYDQSRTGNNLTAVLSIQPIIYNGVSVVTEGSRPALSFDKSNNQDLEKSNPFGMNILDMGSFLVCKSSATPFSFPAGLFLGSTSSQEQNMLGYRTGQIFYSGATMGGSLGNTDYNLFSLYADNASSDVKGYLNGSQILTGTPTSSAVNWINVGSVGTVSNTEWDGTIQEVIVYGNSTKATHTAIESNIQTYYGTP